MLVSKRRRSPTHAGGLFAIDKSWFQEIGLYDPGLQIWGGEQYELSFKVHKNAAVISFSMPNLQSVLSCPVG